MKTVMIRFPDFASMSDEEMQRHALTNARDGRWSLLTHWLLERFGTDQLELGDAWARTWWGWECPACKRPKMDIARLTDQNVLLCQLDEHHDHLIDHLKKVIGRDIPGAALDEIGAIRRRAFATIFPLVERFERQLICNDCNAADGKMKKEIGQDIPAHFSFSPSEIAAFIVASPNAPHKLEVDIGEAIWNEAKADFEQRIAFAETMAERITQGLHDREQGRSDLTRTGNVELFYRMAFDQLSANDRPSGLEDAIRRRSISRHGKALTKKKARQKHVPPTAAEFSDLDNRLNAESIPWRSAGSNWRCEICDRSKFEILRRSNKGVWTAKVMQFEAYEDEIDPRSLRLRYNGREGARTIGTERLALICQDCRQVVTDAVSLIPEADHRCMSLADIRSLIGDPLPHLRHDVDKEEMLDLVRNNGDWISAVGDYLRHRNDAIDVSMPHHLLMVRDGLSADAARATVIPMLVDAGRLSPVDAEERFDWLMAERSRLG